MRFFLDTHRRFELIACETGGWELVDGDKKVHYCRKPVDALAYMSDVLIAEPCKDILARLGDIEQQIKLAAEIMHVHDIAISVASVYSKLPQKPVDKKKHVKTASLQLANCKAEEFKFRDDRHEVVAIAKAILDPWFEENDAR